MDRKTRQEIRQARERLVFAEEPAALDEAYALHVAQSRAWRAHRPLPLELSRRLLEDAGDGLGPVARLFTVRRGGALVCATLVLDHPREAMPWWSGADPEARRLHAFPLPALVGGRMGARARGARASTWARARALGPVAAFKDSLGARTGALPGALARRGAASAPGPRAGRAPAPRARGPAARGGRMRIATLSNASVEHTRRWVALVPRARARGARVVARGAARRASRRSACRGAPLPGFLRYPLALPALERALERFAPDLVDAHYVPNYGLLGALAGRRPLSVTAWGSDLLVAGPARTAAARARPLRAAARRPGAGGRGEPGRGGPRAGGRAREGAHDPLGRGSRPLPAGRGARARPAGERAHARAGLRPRDHPARGEAGAGAPTRARAWSWPGRAACAPRSSGQAAALLPAGRWRFAGRLGPEELAALLARADVYLSASRSDSTSVSLLEAMAAGAVPVVSDIEGNREWVARGRRRAAVPVRRCGRARRARSSACSGRGVGGGGAGAQPPRGRGARGPASATSAASRRCSRGSPDARRGGRDVNRRLLLLCYFYPPLAGGGVHRVLGFTRWLPEHGWDCTVVCAGPEDYWVRDETLEGRIPPRDRGDPRAGGQRALRLAQAEARLGRAAGPGPAAARAGPAGAPAWSSAACARSPDWLLLPDSYAGWAAPRAARRGRAARARGTSSAVLSTSPPDSVHLAALPLARRFGLPWVADFRDPWIGLHFRRPPTRVARGPPARPRAPRADRGGPRAGGLAHPRGRPRARCRGATRVASCTCPTATSRTRRGPASALARDADHFTLVFTGTLSLMPDAEVLLEALHQVLARRPEARRRIRARLAGPVRHRTTRTARWRSASRASSSSRGRSRTREARALQRGRGPAAAVEAARLPHDGAGQDLRVPGRGPAAARAARAGRRGGAAGAPRGRRSACRRATARGSPRRSSAATSPGRRAPDGDADARGPPGLARGAHALEPLGAARHAARRTRGRGRKR